MEILLLTYTGTSVSNTLANTCVMHLQTLASYTCTHLRHALANTCVMHLHTLASCTCTHFRHALAHTSVMHLQILPSCTCKHLRHTLAHTCVIHLHTLAFTYAGNSSTRAQGYSSRCELESITHTLLRAWLRQRQRSRSAYQSVLLGVCEYV